jgi:folate-binding protein YgfZ
VPRLAFDEAKALIFTGKDVEKFIDGLSTNKVEFSKSQVIDTLVLNNKAKILGQLHLFQLNHMVVSVTVADNFEELVKYLESKILAQEVAINDVTSLNFIDIVYDEGSINKQVTIVKDTTIIGINGMYSIELYSVKQSRKHCDGDSESFTNWRVDNLIPWYNYEISNSVNPYQCGLGYQVHENKGCYTGQEILTRMRTRNKGIFQLISRENRADEESKPTTQGSERSLYLEKS